MANWQLLPNKAVNRRGHYPSPLAQIVGLGLAEEPFREIAKCSAYAATPLRLLPSLAAEVGISQVYFKDESCRFRLGSFKALGGIYATGRVVQAELSKRLKRQVTFAELIDGYLRSESECLTVICATDGNHGRAVAAGARLFGCKSVIVVHEGVSQERVDAITSFGAEVLRIGSTYDESVHLASLLAERRGSRLRQLVRSQKRHDHGKSSLAWLQESLASIEDTTPPSALGDEPREWFVVSDTSYPGYEVVPRFVMQGYTVMVREVLEQLARIGSEKPTHVFLQAGVGSFAASVTGYLWDAWGRERPRVIVVEPEKAACLYESVRTGKPTKISGPLDTMMAGLACGEPSLLAWEILSTGADFFMTLDDAAAIDAMRQLVRSPQQIVSGESGAAGLAGFLALAQDPTGREAIGLGPESRVLLFGTEGATDASLFRTLTGYDPETRAPISQR